MKLTAQKFSKTCSLVIVAAFLSAPIVGCGAAGGEEFADGDELAEAGEFAEGEESGGSEEFADGDELAEAGEFAEGETLTDIGVLADADGFEDDSDEFDIDDKFENEVDLEDAFDFVDGDSELVNKATGTRINRVSTSGSGCPSGSARTVLSGVSRSRQEASVLFSRFETGSKRTCTIKLRFELPRKVRAIVTQASYRGNAEPESGESARFAARPSSSKSVRGDFRITSTRQLRSACGGTSSISVNSEARMSKSSSSSNTIQVDTADISVRYVKC